MISTYGGITSTQGPGGAGSVMDVAVVVDGNPMGNPSQRISIVPHPSLPQDGVDQAQSESWGFTAASFPVASGTHIVSVRVRHIAGPPINVGSVLDGTFTESGRAQLQVLVIKR